MIFAAGIDVLERLASPIGIGIAAGGGSACPLVTKELHGRLQQRLEAGNLPAGRLVGDDVTAPDTS